MTDEWFQRILDLIELQKYDLAIREARDVLKKDPENAVAHYYIAWSFWKLGRLNDAIQSAQKALRHNPEYAHVHSLMGVLLDQTGKLQKAVAYHQKAIQLMPGEADIHVAYAYHLYRCFPSSVSAPVIYPHTPLWKDWQDAFHVLEQALKLNPNHAGAYRARAMWWVKKQNFADARQDALTALRIAPTNPFNHALLGDIYLAEYQASKAFAAYREALRLAPNNSDIRKGLVNALAARTPWVGALWRLSWGQPGGWRGGLLAVLVLLPFLCAYAFNLPTLTIGYAVFVMFLFIFLNTVGNSLLTQAVIKGWIKI
jgi:tetratricopeptide (TPR) repeat protein